MSLNYYKLYVNQVLDLSKTMVIKVEAVADSINERLKATYGTYLMLMINVHGNIILTYLASTIALTKKSMSHHWILYRLLSLVEIL
jgi:hypothetical protein